MDENYNEDFLNGSDKDYIQGYDVCFDAIISLIASNLDVYEGELTELCPEGYTPEEDECFTTREDLYEIMVENKEIICAIIKDWLEMTRDEIITSLIDSMDDKEYESLKAKAIEENKNKENPKEYHDTRKLYNGTSGDKKEE